MPTLRPLFRVLIATASVVTWTATLTVASAQTPLLPRNLDLSRTTFIVPQNDGEARAIITLLKEAGATDVRVSLQSWGAALNKEPEENLKNLRPTVVAVELPAPELEARLRAEGRTVLAIDHHSYGELNRTNPKSSLEQVAALIGRSLDHFQMGVAINDRGYIFGLRDAGYSDQEIKDIRKNDLTAQGFTPDMLAQSERDFANRRVAGEVTIIETTLNKVGYISDLQTIAAGNAVKDLVVFSTNANEDVTEVNFFGNPAHAKKLQADLGGWSGGNPERSMYWGKDGKDLNLGAIKNLLKIPVDVAKVDLSRTTFIVPQNDGEARAIIALLREAGATDVRVSAQNWGAALDKEPAGNLKDLKSTVVAVELPAAELEAKLRAEGHTVLAIDHHSYGELNRSNPKSSLEQIAELIHHPLDRFQMGIAINDRGYIFGLRDAGYSDEEIKAIRKNDLAAQGFTPEMLAQSERDFANRRVAGDLTIVETTLNKVGYISDLQTIAAGNAVKDLAVVSLDPNHHLTEFNFFGNPAHAKKLQAELGGWSGGNPERSMYWGKDSFLDLRLIARALNAPELDRNGILACLKRNLH